MSIFWLGGDKKVVPLEEIQATEESENRYFLPGVIHGGQDYVIEIYGWMTGEHAEDARIEAKYLFAKDILKWAKEAEKDNEFDEEYYEELINENAETFIIDNDGSGDYHTLNEEWEKAVVMTNEELINWARKQIEK